MNPQMAAMVQVGAGMELDLTKLLAARLRASRARPYLAGALHAMSVVACPAVGTMGVDRYWRCYAAPAFVAATAVEELAGVWLHEVAHLLRDHHGRARRLLEQAASESGVDERSRSRPRVDPDHPLREHLRINLAMDCEINDDLLQRSVDHRPTITNTMPGSAAARVGDGVRLPRGAVGPELLGLAAAPLFEGYLEQLPASALHGRLAWLDCGSGAHGGPAASWELGPDGAFPLSDAEVATIRIRVAEQIRRGQGTASPGWRRWAEDLGRPVQDWRRLLQGLIRSNLRPVTGAGDYAYRRPSRRSPALGGVVLPSLVRPSPSVAVVIDTSGSVADSELGTALAETAAILRAGGTSGNRISVYCCDGDVRTAQSICAVERISLVGGGGTDLRRGIRRALSARPRPDLVVVITDGHTPWPDRQPAARVVVGLLGPEPYLSEDGLWHPSPPPSWAQTVRLG